MKPKNDRQFELDTAWLNLEGENIDLNAPNPLSTIPAEYADSPLIYYLYLMRKPENFHFFCKNFLALELLPFQFVILRELWRRPFPMLIATRGGSKSFLLAVYCIMRAFFKQGSKIVVIGASFRQSKILFDYIETIWWGAHLLRSALAGCSGKQGPSKEPDKYTMHIGDSTIVCIPLGDGSKIRGLRANTIIADEFASINPNIYEVVIMGFGAVASNPVESVKYHARVKKIKDMGAWTADNEKHFQDCAVSNQAIIAGTADYQFGHFYEYWKKQRDIIMSGGDPEKLARIYGEDGIPKHLSWRDFSIIRLPHTVLPEGFMDEKTIARAKATMHRSNYQREYGACFPVDSQGFYSRKLVESCVVRRDMYIASIGEDVRPFKPLMRGDPNKSYIMGIDPASEADNFSITILELYPMYRKVVYAWTTNKDHHRKQIEAGAIREQDYYSYCCHKIKELRRAFNLAQIGIDSEGGGRMIAEGLRDPDKLRPGELPILPIRDPNDPKPTDMMNGEHILELIKFSSSEWTSTANHGMRKDFEDQVLLFPWFDGVSIVEATSFDIEAQQIYDTLENCYMELEETKQELSSIVHTKTSIIGRDKWDTPEIKEPGGKKGRQRKDRYTSLLIANMIARTIQRAEAKLTLDPLAYGVAHELVEQDTGKPQRLYSQDWYNDAMTKFLEGI